MLFQRMVIAADHPYRQKISHISHCARLVWEVIFLPYTEPPKGGV